MTKSLSSISRSLRDSITKYLSLHLRVYHTPEYDFYSYHQPNTMYLVSNHIDELLLELHPSCIIMWHKCLSILKRNSDSVSACYINMDYKQFDKLMSRNAYYKAKKTLLLKRLLIATSDKKIYIINIMFANKLYKPKLIEEQ